MSKGGKVLKRVRPNLPPVEIKTVQDAIGALNETINLLRKDKIPARTGSAIIAGVSQIFKGLEYAELNNRMERLEKGVLETRPLSRRVLGRQAPYVCSTRALDLFQRNFQENYE